MNSLAINTGDEAARGTSAGDTGKTPFVELRGVSKIFFSRMNPSGFEAIRDIDLSIGSGEFTAVVGPSGCGKSTILNLLAGILPATAGTSYIRGEPVHGISDSVGYLFQRDVLLPWKTVLDSVSLPLRFRGVSRVEAEERASVWVRKVGLTGFERHYPHQLSGGMRKRVALATVFVYNPALLLMDEPFSALDVQTRNLMENELLDLWNEQKKTVIFVTHDLEEAIGLADRVVVMTTRPGCIKQDYSIDLERPRNVNEIRFSPRFTELYRMIWEDLRSEVLAAYEGDTALPPK